ncbi:MAG: hypothetical protein CUN56_12905 [Phototrophicales bacterium]|nr:MAG: hypothetical protein CUN56_12905 [Phototrophicales bacterium]RMG75182.1 MAG: DsbA family protein [Chloroflexota bacterium]
MKQQQQFYLVGGVAFIAVLVFAFAVFIGNQSGATARSGIDYSKIPSTQLEDGTYVLGNPNAPITIVEFADFNCPHCQDYKSTVDEVIKKLVIPGLAKFEFRVYPILGADSVYYAQLLECAAEQGGAETYWLAHEELFYHASRGVNGNDAGRRMAEELNLNYTDLLECTRNADQYNANLEIGRSADVQGTPAVRFRYADGTLQAGASARAGIPFSELEQIVQLANQ